MASGRARSESAAGERFAGLVLEIQSLALDHQRTVVHLRVDVPDVLADDAEYRYRVNKGSLQRPSQRMRRLVMLAPRQATSSVRLL